MKKKKKKTAKDAANCKVARFDSWAPIELLWQTNNTSSSSNESWQRHFNMIAKVLNVRWNTGRPLGSSVQSSRGSKKEHLAKMSFCPSDSEADANKQIMKWAPPLAIVR